MNNHKILFHDCFGEKRIVITKDTHNWIVAIGLKEMDMINFQKKAHRNYFTTLESLFINLFNILLREDLKSLDTETILDSINYVHDFLSFMGSQIESNLAGEEGCFGTLKAPF